jgi:hypothetical protein
MNPYSPPGAMAYPYPPAPTREDGRTVDVSNGMVEVLRQTRPWAILFSILCFVGSAFMMLVSIAVLLAGSSVGATKTATFPRLIGLFYVPLATVYIYPGIKLWAYAIAIGRLVATRAGADLEIALRQQKSFWKYSGIAAIVVALVYFFGIVAFVVVWQYLAPTKH